MDAFRFSDVLILFAFFSFFRYVSFAMSEEGYFFKDRKRSILSNTAVLSNHSVFSSVECGQYCLRYEECFGFNYKPPAKTNAKYDVVNCQLSKKRNVKKQTTKHGEWMYFKAISSCDQCNDDSSCTNGGKCVEISRKECKCQCDVRFEGEKCERERAFNSCAEVLNISSNAKDGVYKIVAANTELNYAHVYCLMTSLAGCAGGGWTMAMKINGSKDTFRYTSPFWTNYQSFNIEAGRTAFDLEESKLPTFWSTPFNEICIGMKFKHHLNFLSFSYPATSLYSLFADGQHRATSVPREKWKSLLPDSSLQNNCQRQGFNVDVSSFVDVRLGYLGNQENDCRTTDSYIGLGATYHRKEELHCSYRLSLMNTAGNAARCGGDNGDVQFEAMAYLLVR